MNDNIIQEIYALYNFYLKEVYTHYFDEKGELVEYYDWGEFRHGYTSVFSRFMQIFGLMSCTLPPELDSQQHDAVLQILKDEVEKYNNLFGPNHTVSIEKFTEVC